MMTLVKIIVMIMILWIILKIKRFISGIKLTSAKSEGIVRENNHKSNMDIQDADYEDVE